MWLLPFIICQVYSCTSQLELLSMSALSFPLLLLPHSRASFSSADPNSVFWREFWSFSKHLQRVVLTSSSAVWNKHTHARTHTHTQCTPAASPLMQFSTMWKINSVCWHLPYSFGLQCQTESPPQPNQVTSSFPAVSERASDSTWPNRPDGWAVFAFCFYLFMCLFLHPFLPPPPPVKRRKSCLVTSGVICERHNLWLHLWTRTERDSTQMLYFLINENK